MIANYFMQIGALRYGATHRDELPENLYLASFDDSEFAAVAGIPGLSIAQPIDQIGRRAAEILLDRIAGTDTTPFRTERLPTTLVFNGEEP
jgi:LacI family transcriptional regulator